MRPDFLQKMRILTLFNVQHWLPPTTTLRTLHYLHTFSSLPLNKAQDIHRQCLTLTCSNDRSERMTASE